MGDEWYSARAREVALQDGWHLRGQLAICPACWDKGARYNNIKEGS